MAIDPERLKPQKGEPAVQINTRTSEAVETVLDWLVFKHDFSSKGSLLLDMVGRCIEADAPGIREVLGAPPYSEIERLARITEALDSICPVDTEPKPD
jgi:hypothetical protein